MRPLPTVSALCLLALACPRVPCRAAEFDDAKLRTIPTRMKRFVEEGVIAGAVTVVGNAKGVAALDAVGSRSREAREPMRTDAVFRIASMTKPVTAVGIMILADEGKLAVDDPVEKHLPEFKGQWLVGEGGKDRLVLRKPSRPVTLRDLLTHTGGMPDYPPGLMPDLFARRRHTLAEVAMALSQRPLAFEPGARWSYSNTGIDTLGRVIEVASGKPYDAFLAERVFKPLGMKDTTFWPAEADPARLAELYGIKDGKLVPLPGALIGLPKGAKYPFPAGGLLSTGADVARFYRMMLNGGTLDGKRVLSAGAVKEMTRVQTGKLACGFTPGMGYGLGFAVVREPQGVTAMLSPGSFGHGGAFGTQSWADPTRDLFAILMIQRVGLPNSDASAVREAFQKLAVAAVR